MKIIAIDVSHNVSPQKAGLFLRLHANADMIYVFDHQYVPYDSVKELRQDLNLYADEFYNRPCAYYDMVIAILSRAKAYQPDSIIIFSPGVDECSRFSNDYTFHNYIRHFKKYHPDILTLDYSITGPAEKHPWRSTRSYDSGLKLWDMLFSGEDSEEDEGTEPAEISDIPESTVPSFHLFTALKELFL